MILIVWIDVLHAPLTVPKFKPLETITSFPEPSDPRVSEPVAVIVRAKGLIASGAKTVIMPVVHGKSTSVRSFVLGGLETTATVV